MLVSFQLKNPNDHKTNTIRSEGTNTEKKYLGFITHPPVHGRLSSVDRILSNHRVHRSGDWDRSRIYSDNGRNFCNGQLAHSTTTENQTPCRGVQAHSSPDPSSRRSFECG